MSQFSQWYRFASKVVSLQYCTEFSVCTCSCTVGKTQVPFRMAIGNVELIHE